MKEREGKIKEEFLFIKVFDREKWFDTEGDEEKSIIYKVFLPINPRSVSFSISRIYSTVQTCSPKRVVVLDWGIDMPEISVSAQTGRILPFDLIYSELDFSKVTYEDLISLPISSTAMLEESLLWTEVEDLDFKIDTLGALIRKRGDEAALKEASALRYLLVKLLEKIYKEFDANSQMLCMDWMRRRYWGVITSFKYEISVESMWNIKYEFTFRQFPQIQMPFLEEPNKEAVVEGG